MTTTTASDVVTAAMSIADDVAQGHLDPERLESQLTEELRDLFVVVVGPEDPLWPIQTDVARQVVSRGGIPTDELSEWLAVQHRRENPDASSETLSAPVPIDGADTPPEVSSSGSGPHSPESDPADDDFADLPPSVIKEAEQAAMAIVNEWREANR